MSLTTIDIDDAALEELMRVTGIRTKKEAVNMAIREVADRNKRIAAYEYYAERAQHWDYEGWKRRRDAEKGRSE
ncbi:type II toxin-antitoxin system VapB family antitoxin [Streptomyces sp. KLOTTS4A1]|uniref:type II toxin-antitoxin system VapB family antitoxin n=1 Tax=Streptomyces sp. KLOTTS4A1 TaxID=3390996 RepID=UPI0039F595B3